MTALSQDEYPIVQQLPPVKFEPAHRANTVTGGHPLMPNLGVHVRARRPRAPYVAAVLIPLALVLLALLAIGTFGRPATAQILPPGPFASTSTAPCTFPQDNPE